jgi:hypothetical protein
MKKIFDSFVVFLMFFFSVIILDQVIDLNKYSFKPNYSDADKIVHTKSKLEMFSIPDVDISDLFVKEEKLDQSPNFYSNSLTEDVLISQKVLFPHIHILMLFKETSFCSSEKRDGVRPTLCSYNWGEILDWDFNPHNYGGIKKARRRETTCIESIGEYFTRLAYQGYVDSSDQKIKQLMSDPHCIYSDAYSFAKDVRLLQLDYFKSAKKYHKNKFGHFRHLSDLNDYEYIELLRTIGYNPYAKYYDAKDLGLYDLLDDYYDGEFQAKYEEIYNRRMNSSFY